MNRLLTIPPSHYCEKARWALDRAGVAYVEEGHAPILHLLFVPPRTGTRTVPALLRDGAPPLTQSSDIVRWADSFLAAERDRLFPPELPEVEPLVRRFDDELGPAARRLAYCFISKSGPLFAAAFGEGMASRAEARVLAAGNPLFRAALGRIFKVSERARRRSHDAVRAVFADVATTLADGRPYLVGGRFTAADLTFTALAGPVLMYRYDEARLRDADPGFAALVVEQRATPAGRWAFSIMERHREERVARER